MSERGYTNRTPMWSFNDIRRVIEKCHAPDLEAWLIRLFRQELELPEEDDLPDKHEYSDGEGPVSR